MKKIFVLFLVLFSFVFAKEDYATKKDIQLIRKDIQLILKTIEAVYEFFK